MACGRELFFAAAVCDRFCFGLACAVVFFSEALAPPLELMPVTSGLALQVLVAEDTAPPPKKPAVPVFVHGLGIPPVPGRLVEKILDGQFVDMAELLPDNIELLCREATVPRWSSDSKARLRQISSITT